MGTMGLALPWRASAVPTEGEKFEAVNGAAPRPEQPASYLAEIGSNGTSISSAARERGMRVEPAEHLTGCHRGRAVAEGSKHGIPSPFGVTAGRVRRGD
jgi:hypothetical protein